MKKNIKLSLLFFLHSIFVVYVVGSSDTVFRQFESLHGAEQARQWRHMVLRWAVQPVSLSSKFESSPSIQGLQN